MYQCWRWGGVVNVSDTVLLVCAHLGQEPSDKVVDQMMSEAPGPLNFTMFLTLFGEKLNGE